MNTIGLIAATTTILTIWFGHVLVRELEARISRILPAILICVLLGIIFEIGAWVSVQPAISAASGIIGITFLWDALELIRQEKRVKIGHTAANPRNARHARILLQYPSATTVDIMDRNPRGSPYTQAQIESILHPLEIAAEEKTE
jgi:uncharacterized membrane protein